MGDRRQDMNAIKELKLDDVLDDLRTRAMQRIEELVSEGLDVPPNAPRRP